MNKFAMAVLLSAGTLVSFQANAADRAVVLPCVPEDGERTLLTLQVSTHSTLGSLALHAGGILVDHG